MNSIRNFSIISHINHGKTTLTDRLLEAAGVKLAHQRLLDSHPIEQEKGITIKLAPVRLNYQLQTTSYQLNLIDTPGHIDFSYEVSRALAACEGAVLLADAVSGIQAQTVSNFGKALEEDLVIIPAINKIDLQEAEPEKTAQELKQAFGFQKKEILFLSAKTGQGVRKLIATLIQRIPAPKGKPEAPLKALIFNLSYQPHLGLILFLRIINGTLNVGDQLQFLNQKVAFKTQKVGYFTPTMQETKNLLAGEVGFVATGLKDYSFCPVGETLTKLKVKSRFAGKSQKSKVIPLPGYRQPKPVVFADIYPLENQEFPNLYEAIRKLKLNDSSLSFKITSSPTLGKGLRVGFLGLLHAQITQERLTKDYGLELIITQPSVSFQILLKSGKEKLIRSPEEFPESSTIKEIQEPFIKVSVFSPSEFTNNIIKLSFLYQAKLLAQKYYGDKVEFFFLMPLSEFISGFFDDLKSCSSGFASLDWQPAGFKKTKVSRLDVFINKELIKPLSRIVPQKKALKIAQKSVANLKTVIPRQQFSVPIQVACNSKVIARADLKAFRKDVTAKLYGGDQTRKDKLLKKQKQGKKKLKRLGKIHLPQEAFWQILSE